MATDAKTGMTDGELLHFYVGLRLQNDRNLPIPQILKDFPEYLRERQAMRGMIREAQEAIATGRSGPMDIEKVIYEVIEELAAEGITE
jgi:hypothetical protein